MRLSSFQLKVGDDGSKFQVMAFDKVHFWGLLAVGLLFFVGVSQSQDEESPEQIANPCKANPCGHGVCLVDNENA